jgi:single-strand DNA-binding protein
MSAFQQLIILGNLGSDPEMRYTQDGKPVTTFSVAVNEKRGEKESTTWFRVTAWQKLAETCHEYLKKGRQVMVIGRVAASAWKAQDGSPRASLEVTASDVRFLGGAPGPANAGEIDEDDVPF